jgi:NADH-quinone oxidoreductase subunit I
MAVIRPLLIGFATTFKHLFRKPITVNYPDQKFPMFPKFRGKQVLMRDENGLEKCVACGLCSVACPADANLSRSGRKRRQRAGRPPLRLRVSDSQDALHLLRVLRRSLPVGAIFMGKDYELAVYSKDDFVWDKADLLVPAATSPTPSAGRQDRLEGQEGKAPTRSVMFDDRSRPSCLSCQSCPSRPW